MKKLFSRLTRADRGPDAQFGTGLWRHNHDRFLRAVDRYYATALAIHQASPPVTSTSFPPATSQSSPPTASASETITSGTHRLNDLVTQVDEITAWLHTHCPVDGQVVPGHVRRVVGDVPELLTRASAKVAEAVLAASMARTHAGGNTSARTWGGPRASGGAGTSWGAGTSGDGGDSTSDASRAPVGAGTSDDPLTSAAEATERYIADAAELLDQVRRTLAEADVP